MTCRGLSRLVRHREAFATTRNRQDAYCFQNRDKTGLLRTWTHDGTYEAFLQSDLLLEVRAVLKKYARRTL